MKYCIAPFDTFWNRIDVIDNVEKEKYFALHGFQDSPENRKIIYQNTIESLRRDNILCDDPEHNHLAFLTH